MHGVSLVAVSEGFFVVAVRGLLAVASPIAAHGASAALHHGGSSQTRDGTCVPALAGGFLTSEPPGKSQS